MYVPYMRGKQNELIALRNTAAIMAEAGFVPVIEPVNDNLKYLERTLQVVNDAGGRAVVIVNPKHGFYKNQGGKDIIEPFNKMFATSRGKLMFGIRLHRKLSVLEAAEKCESMGGRPTALIHDGIKIDEGFPEKIWHHSFIRMHVFLENRTDETHRRLFAERGIERALIKDAQIRCSNHEYPEFRSFSDLHTTYSREGLDGFGDFLIVGDKYNDGGGAPRTIAIHLTYIDPNLDDMMCIRHFLSDSGRDSQKNMSGKGREALAKLIKFIDGPEGRKVYRSSALAEFRKLHALKHFTSLGKVKRLSMVHHIETLADYWTRSSGLAAA